MRRFLVVGCGGAGGKTVAYLMDRLGSDLSKDGVEELPAGWQFMLVDGPSGVENGPDGLRNVVDQGGTYVGTGPRGGYYPDLDQALSQQLRATQTLDEIGTWAPVAPDQVTTPVNVGAGQYRAIGRMMFLARAAEVQQALGHAYEKLVTRDTITSMTNAAHAVGTTFDPSLPPIVFVIGSMAGGSGASMVLDVCRLLTQVPGVNPKLLSIFMISPDVFDSLPLSARSGVQANALAIFGEIISSQTGAARRHDVTLLGGLGLNDGEGTPVPFARVFPVGRLMGAQQALFGDGSMNAVYRKVARGLAGMMTNDMAVQQFVDFDLGDSGSVPANPRYLGWGAQAAPISWGSYGFASLSMGRDRYAEYAAQRIARSAVDRLLDGHLGPGSSASGTEQVNALVDSQWSSICDLLQLPFSRLSAKAVEFVPWMTIQALPRESAEVMAQRVTETEFSQFVPPPNEQGVAQWREQLLAQSAARRQPVAQAVARAAYEWAFDWHQALIERLLRTISDSIANLGLAYAGALVDRLSTHFAEFVVSNAQHLSRASSTVDLTEFPAQVIEVLSARRGAITGGDALVNAVVESIQDRVCTELYNRASGLIGDGLRTFVADVLEPLRSALNELQTILEEARYTQRRHDGLSPLQTTHYSSWPSDHDLRVPERFDEASNEVLLTSSTQFAARFAADLQASVPAKVAGPSASNAVVTQVIAGVWVTTEGVQPPGGLIETTVGWRSRAFPTDPETGESLVPSEARFDVHCRPAELLARARIFVARPGESFERFCSASLRDYLTADGRESEQEQRHREVVTKFREALAQAVPLVSVDERTVQILHGGRSVEYRYRFSAVPFGSLAITRDLERALTTNPSADASSLANLQYAFTDQGNPRRIDVFSSYPHYSPLAFDSVLEPVIREWDALPPQGRAAYWTHRRARPLDASLAMSVPERRAMVAGWYIGQLVGEIRLPEPPYSHPVQIWDPQDLRWVGFPYPMLTPPDRFRARFDWLPAVLESHLLALARVQQQPILSSLKPYLLLRELYDDSELGPATGIVEVSALEKLAAWLRGGSASGDPSGIESVAAATNAIQRWRAARRWLTEDGGPGDLAVRHFLPPSDTAAPGGTFSTITSRTQAAETPLFRDLASDVAWATRQVRTLLDQARTVNQNRVPDVAAKDIKCPRCFHGLMGEVYAWECTGTCEARHDPTASAYTGTEVRSRPIAKMRRPSNSRKWVPPETVPCHTCNQPGRDICPHCHFTLLPRWRTAATVTVALAGARAVGKSSYLAVAVEQLEETLTNAKIHVQFADPQSRQTYEDHYAKPLFGTRTTMAITPSARVVASYQRDPLMLRFDTGHQLTTLVIRDVAGEDLENPSDDLQHLSYLSRADATLFFFDPSSAPSVRGLVTGSGPLTRDDIRGTERALETVLRVIGAAPVPVGIVLSKFDEMQALGDIQDAQWSRIMANPGAAFSRDPRSGGIAYDTVDGDLLHEEARSLMAHLSAQKIVNAVLAATNHDAQSYRIFTVSALGAPAVGAGLDQRGVAPFRCLDPLRWVLSLRGAALGHRPSS